MRETFGHLPAESPEIQDVSERDKMLADHAIETAQNYTEAGDIALDDSDVVSDAWWAEELKLLEKYVDHEAPYHVGRTFMIGEEMFEVWFVKPDGSEGNYSTKWIDMKNLTTGEMVYDIPPEQVDVMIETAESNHTPRLEQSGSYEAIIHKELTAFDERFASEPDARLRAEFEAFLRGHPELFAGTIHVAI